jgi:hypothetical protein
MTARSRGMTPETLAVLLAARTSFDDRRHLTGHRCRAWNKTAAGKRGMRGSAARVLAGALNERGTAGVIGAGSRFPALGMLDPAPAMGLALPEARYIIRHYDTPLAWWLGPEVYTCAPAGKWIEVAECCNADYGRFTPTTTRRQQVIHQALVLIGAAE